MTSGAPGLFCSFSLLHNILKTVEMIEEEGRGCKEESSKEEESKYITGLPSQRARLVT